MGENESKIIQCPICHKEIPKEKFINHLKEHPSYFGNEKIIEILKDQFKLIEEITPDLVKGDKVTILYKIKAVKVFTFPPLDFFYETSDRMEFEPEYYITQIAGREIKLGKGFFLLEDAKSNKDAFFVLNDIISLLNIIGIPIEYINYIDMIMIGTTPKDQKVELVKSTLSQKKISNIPVININLYETTVILLFLHSIWNKIQENDYIRNSRIYEFLGHARLALFNHNNRIAFINAWTAIEAILRNVWEKKIEEKYGSKTAIEKIIGDSRNWTTNVITEELFLLDYLPLEKVKKIRKLRKKRNDVFHASSLDKMIVSSKEASSCIGMSLFLFFKELGIDKIVDMLPVHNRIYRAL
ncbi:MAG: hypothetical protein ACFFDG_14075, partial [Promethearchaeota archaeon]